MIHVILTPTDELVKVDADVITYCSDSGFIELSKNGNIKAAFNASAVLYYIEVEK